MMASSTLPRLTGPGHETHNRVRRDVPLLPGPVRPQYDRMGLDTADATVMWIALTIFLLGVAVGINISIALFHIL